MIYSKVVLKTEKVLSLKERKNIVDKLYPRNPHTINSLEARNMGIIRKFNNALGYKKFVSNHVVGEGFISPEITHNTDFKTPENLLYDGVKVILEGENVLEFTIPNKRQTLNTQGLNYSYMGKDIAVKWCQYLKKLLPEHQVIFSDSEVKPKEFETEVERAIDFFFRNMYTDMNNLTVEYSSKELLNKYELESINKVLNEVFDYPLHVQQYYCETCVGHSKGSRPYHTEVVYD